MKAHLDLSGIKKLKSKLKKLENKEVEWGFLGGQHSTADMTYAALAWLLEEGSRSSEGGYAIPPRPAFKQLISQLRTSHVAYEQEVSNAYRQFLEGGNHHQILRESGEYLTQRHKDTMTSWLVSGSQNQHNAPLTIELKGFDMPFVESGELVQNVTYQIK